jgi:hypothetical protein
MHFRVAIRKIHQVLHFQVAAVVEDQVHTLCYLRVVTVVRDQAVCYLQQEQHDKDYFLNHILICNSK